MYDKQIDRRWIGSVKAWMAAVDGTTEGFDIERLTPSFDLISGINEMISPPLCLYPLFGVNRRLS